MSDMSRHVVLVCGQSWCVGHSRLRVILTVGVSFTSVSVQHVSFLHLLRRLSTDGKPLDTELHRFHQH